VAVANSEILVVVDVVVVDPDVAPAVAVTATVFEIRALEQSDDGSKREDKKEWRGNEIEKIKLF
jgi:hypothetical protein